MTDGSLKRRSWVVLLPSLLATLPVWVAARPPMIDIPQYAAQVKLFDDVRTPGFVFRDLFVVDLFTPYVAGYVLVWTLARFVGLVCAVKLALSVALAALPLAASRLFQRNGGDPAWAWLVVPVGYGFCFNWGFINFLLALPIGILLLDGVIRFARAPSFGGGVVIALLVHLLFFSHLLVLFFFGTLAAAIAISEARSGKRALTALLPLGSVVPVTLAWGLSSLWHEAQVRGALDWDLAWTRLPFFFTYMLGEDPALDTILVGGSLFVLPLLAGARVNREPRRWLPVVACLLVTLFAPQTAGGAFYLHQRFPMLLVPLFLYALDAHAGGAKLRAATAELAAATLAVAWIAVAVLRCATFESEARDFEPVLARMQPARRVLSLIFDPFDRAYRCAIFLHYPVWYEVLKDGLVDFNFAQNYNEPVRYRAERQPPVGRIIKWGQTAFDWDWDREAPYEYLIVRDDPEAATAKSDLLGPRAKLVLRSGPWSLFEIDAPKG